LLWHNAGNEGLQAFARAGFATFWLIAAVPLLVLLTTPHVVVEDGGLHLSNAMALRGLIEGWFPSLVSWRPVLAPNMTVEIVLAALTTVMSGNLALKVVIAVGLLGYAFAVAALMRAAHLPVYYGIPLLALEMHYFVMLGFVGFVWAVPLALGALAVVVRDPLTPPKLPLALLLVATWFTHVVPALTVSIAITLVVLVARLAEHQRLAGAIVTTVKALAVPLIPVALLTITWFVQAPAGDLHNGPGVLSEIKHLLQFSDPLVAYARIEYWFARALAVVAYAVAAVIIVVRVKERRFLDRMDGLLAASVVMAVLSFAAPEHTGSGAGFVGLRLALFAILFLLLWECMELPTLTGRARAGSIAMIGVGAFVAVAIPIVRVPALHQLSAEIDQIGALAPCLPLHSAIMQVNLDAAAAVSPRLNPMAEQTGAITVSRQSLDLFNESGWFPFYMWRYTDTAHADRYVVPGRSFDEVPTPIDLGSAIDDGLPLSGVVIYGRAAAPQEVLGDPTVTRLDHDLAQHFRVVRQTSNAELWLRKGVAPSC
jgi:hypothetical protein